MRRSLAVSLFVMLVALVAAALPAGAQSARPSAFRVTITNLTGGQPLTPPVAALHNAGFDVFTVGQPASFEVKEIAENGNSAPLLGVLGRATASVTSRRARPARWCRRGHRATRCSTSPLRSNSRPPRAPGSCQ